MSREYRQQGVPIANTRTLPRVNTAAPPQARAPERKPCNCGKGKAPTEATHGTPVTP